MVQKYDLKKKTVILRTDFYTAHVSVYLSMKILHTADWHLGATFHGHNRTIEHRHFLDWLLATLRERRPDALLVAGDVFDTSNPPAAAEELFYDFMTEATRAVPGLQVVVVAGNHDSGARMEAPARLLRGMGVYVRGLMPYVDDADEPDLDHLILPLAPLGQTEATCVCLAMPYLRAADCPQGLTQSEGLAFWFDRLHRCLKRTPFKGLPVVVAAHFYAAGAQICAGAHSERLVVGGQDCVNPSVVGRDVSYTALGHLHRAQQVAGGPNVYYAGSALPMSFAEQAYQHGAWWVDLDNEGAASVSRLAYEPLRHLLSIPSSSGRAATRQEVLDACAALPHRAKNDRGDDWPYLEIRLEEEQPEPELLHEVMQLLSDRAVRFCRMERVRKAGGTVEDLQPPTPEELRHDDPFDLAQSYYQQCYHADMPRPMSERFDQARSRLSDASVAGEEKPSATAAVSSPME